MKNSFKVTSAPAEIRAAIKVLSKRYPALAGGEKATALKFKKNADASQPSTVWPQDDGLLVCYSTKTQALRLVGQILAGAVPSPESCPFEHFGIMLDCSRNAVPQMDYFKSILDRLALLGYNNVLLYCEDTFKMPSEPYYGLYRNGFTGPELRELDDYAYALGIELVPCLETLAHLDQIFKWKAYADVRDRDGIILIDEPKTYELLEKVITFWTSNLRSRRVHLGMDEAVGVGSGKFKEKFGEQNTFEIINRHLSRLADFCKKRGLVPYMWSDMWFRACSKDHAYYDKSIVVPREVAAKIPDNVVLSYWDYYHAEKDMYDHFIATHYDINKQRGCEASPQMASGVWTWNQFWHWTTSTEKTAVPAILASREAKLNDLVFTMWGDDGAFCDFESSFAGLAFCAEYAYSGKADEKVLEKIYDAICPGASYKLVSDLGRMGGYMLTRMIWDDPIMMQLASHLHRWRDEFRDGHLTFTWDGYKKGLADNLRRISRAKNPKDGIGGSLTFAKALFGEVLCKLELFDAVLDAWKLPASKRPAAVKAKVLPKARKLLAQTKAFELEFRAMWKRHNRPMGYETTEIRLAAGTERTRELVSRLSEFASGKAKTMPEYDDLMLVKDTMDFMGIGWGRLTHGTTIE